VVMKRPRLTGAAMARCRRSTTSRGCNGGAPTPACRMCAVIPFDAIYLSEAFERQLISFLLFYHELPNAFSQMGCLTLALIDSD
jgi:hypothetical protein